MPDPSTDTLLRQASRGDQAATEQLLGRHRDRLHRMVTVHFDSRLAPRLDPSDVVQEVLGEASQKLPEYLQDRPVSFYPWLRQIAWQQLAKLHRQHLAAQKRSIHREEMIDVPLPDQSAMDLAQRFVKTGSSPSQRLLRQELSRRVQDALGEMASTDREVLVLRYLEQLSTSEISEISGISEAAVKMRHARALQRLRRVLDDES